MDRDVHCTITIPTLPLQVWYIPGNTPPMSAAVGLATLAQCGQELDCDWPSVLADILHMCGQDDCNVILYCTVMYCTEIVQLNRENCHISEKCV